MQPNVTVLIELWTIFNQPVAYIIHTTHFEKLSNHLQLPLFTKIYLTLAQGAMLSHTSRYHSR